MQKINIKYIFFLFFSLFVFFVDRYTKFFFMGIEGGIKISNYLSFVSSWNSGISFGIFYKIPSYVLIFVTFIIICCLMVFFINDYRKEPLFVLSISSMVGGACGNLYDRVFYGAVYDFIYFVINGYGMPIFNFADMAITFGGALFCFLIIIKRI